MVFSNDMIAKARKATSADDLLNMASLNGISMSKSEAEEYYSFLHTPQELDENDLDAVVGGVDEGKWDTVTTPSPTTPPKPSPKYSNGQKIRINTYPAGNNEFVIETIGAYDENYGYCYKLQYQIGFVYLETMSVTVIG